MIFGMKHNLLTWIVLQIFTRTKRYLTKRNNIRYSFNTNAIGGLMTRVLGHYVKCFRF